MNPTKNNLLANLIKCASLTLTLFMLCSDVSLAQDLAQVGDQAQDSGSIKTTEKGEKGEKESNDEEQSAESISPYKPFVAKPLPVIDGPALVIPIHGTIDLGIPPYIERALSEHPEAEIIILEIDTLGGRVDAAIKIRDLLLTEGRPTLAYVYRRAISAGALISYATDYIVFSPGSTMGAATPIQVDKGQAKAVGEKMVSYFRSEMRATAEANGRDGDVAEAMVDADKVVSSISVKGKLLTLTNTNAETWGISNATIDSPAELYKTLGLNPGQISRSEESWSESIARAVTDPTLSGLLMSVGMLGIMIELYTPGIGFAGILGFFSLITFFLGHKVAGLAGSEELLLIILGIILLAAELFVIPGFGIAGILGILCLAGGLVTSMGELPDGQMWDYGLFEGPTQTFVYSLVISMILLTIIAKYLPRSSFGSWLVLKEEINHDPTQTSNEEIDDGSAIDLSIKIGQRGTTKTPLRLSGKVDFDGEIYDVISRDEYLEPGQPVEVVECSGSRIAVIALREI
jgi:membrane-bound serine protease (ClpP class)